MKESLLPLRGRDDELGRVRARLEEVATGVGAVVVVEGRAGLGKTRLLAACTALAADMSFRVGQGTADPGPNIVELSALFDALFAGHPPLVARSALRALHETSEQTFWLLQDIQALIEEAALKDPLLICLDDVQWGGNSCALAMRQLPQQLASLPVAWVIAVRPNQGPPAIADVTRALLNAGAEFISLGPLDRKAAAALAADILGAEPDQDLLERAEQAHGTPFLLVEFFRGLQDEGLVAIDGGRARLLANRVPHRLSDSIRGRLARMSRDAERVAMVAASLGRRFTLRDVADMTGATATDLLGAVQELLDADILTESEGQLSFAHDLIREGARASSPFAIRRALDRQAVDVLIDRGALPVEVARQLAASAEPGDDIALATLLEAADSLGVTDPATSAELAGRALELTPARHRLRGALVARRAISLFATGQAAEAARFADGALRQALPAEEEARVRWTVSGMFDISPEVRATSARTALALPGLSLELRALLWASLFHNVVVAVRTNEALLLQAKANDAVCASPDGSGRFALEVAESALRYQRGDFQAALQVLDRAEGEVLPNPEDARQRLARNFRASFLVALDRFDEAMRVADDALAAAHRDRQNWALRVFETWKGRQLLEQGRLAEAASALEGRFTLSGAPGIVGMLEAPNLVALGKIRMHTGDDKGAGEVARIATIMLTAAAPGVKRFAAWYLALHAMYLGDPAAARDWLAAGEWGEEDPLVPVFPFEVSDIQHVARIAAHVGDEKLARRTVAFAEQRSDMNPPVRSLQAAAAHARGLRKGSSEQLDYAVELFDDGLRPLALASALEDLALVKIREANTIEAVAALDRALTIHTQAGAQWDAARIRRRLRRLGIRRRTSIPDRPKTGWEALTSAERAVAQLAADGSTNREIAERLFISPHTVNTHLRHVFEKLGINSRIALSRIAESRGFGQG